MKKMHLVLTILAMCLILGKGAAVTAESNILRLSCSAQIAEALGPRGLHAFEQASGVNLETHICSSEAAVYRLMQGHGDIAGTSQGLPHLQEAHDYVETPICTDSIAVVVNSKIPVHEFSVHQLRMIFSGKMVSWRPLGGPDRHIMVAIPSKETAAYKNFNREVMDREEMRYDLMTHQSTKIIHVVQKFSNAISFISQGATREKPGIRCVRVEHCSVGQQAYPFQQIFSFVTKGTPKGMTKAFVDFWRSPNGQIILREKGMRPITP